MSDANATLRIATPRDAAALPTFGRKCFAKAFAHLYSEESLETFLEQTRSENEYRRFVECAAFKLTIAESPTAGILGYALCGPLGVPVKHPKLPAWELMRLYVDPEAQSLGIGNLLLKMATDEAKLQRFQAIYLGVYSENFAAQRFYKRAGFAKVGTYDFKVGDHVDHE